MSIIDSANDFPNDPSLDDMKERMKIVPKNQHFPCCLVWCPLPFLSAFLPFVGHAGIVASDGTIFDYAADYVVEVCVIVAFLFPMMMLCSSFPPQIRHSSPLFS